ncbi:hypothetical protein [Spirosoma pollinicola]|uniref:Uncharacterized protein n=1 Tax=Spirosoma pollinicola TaxID=2057025 RepID=A0A2K8YTH7_9BACT|nr:hypothetical protein [Spirosoma pollinicola]AUD00884.1 hypothetical protein CWM47_03065 [Spirosoma pollinicola]
MFKTFSFVIVVSLLTLSCKNDSDQEPTEQEAQATFDAIKADPLLGSVPKFKESINDSDSSQLAHLVNEAAPVCSAPQSISSLNSGTDFKVYKFDKDLAASATAMGFTGSIGKKEMVFIEDYIRYSFVNCAGKRVKMGIGLRCFIHVKSLRGKLATTSLPSVAASVELGRANASFELKALGFGIDGDVLADGLQSSAGEYNVDNFGKLAVTFNNTLKLLKSGSNLNISPVELPE